MNGKQEELLLKTVEGFERRVYKLEIRLQNSKLETIRLGHIKIKGESLRRTLRGETV